MTATAAEIIDLAAYRRARRPRQDNKPSGLPWHQASASWSWTANLRERPAPRAQP